MQKKRRAKICLTIETPCPAGQRHTALRSPQISQLAPSLTQPADSTRTLINPDPRHRRRGQVMERLQLQVRAAHRPTRGRRPRFQTL